MAAISRNVNALLDKPAVVPRLSMPDLAAEFFARDTLTVARELIGAELIVGDCAGRVVETEAYTDDAASHAVMRSRQSAVMRETFGHIYVYRIYGMHFCLNLTTDRDGPGAVLIRAVEPTRGIEQMIARRGTSVLKLLAAGPGRLCQAFGVDLSFNGVAIGEGLHVRAGKAKSETVSSRRIGITKAAELEWRFIEKDNSFLSRKA